MSAVPKPYPQEFRDDVVRVAQNREDGVTLEQIAADFGIHPMTLQKWIRKADVEAGIKPGTTSPRNCARPNAAFGCWSRRTRSCAARRRTYPRRICRDKVVPARERARR